jgi:hypothetical protein
VESPSSTTQEPVNLSPGSGDQEAKPAARSGTLLVFSSAVDNIAREALLKGNSRYN